MERSHWVVTVLEKGNLPPCTGEDRLRCKQRLERSVLYSTVVEFGKLRELWTLVANFVQSLALNETSGRTLISVF